MARFYLPQEEWGGSPALTGDEARHFAQVLRGKPGDSVTVFDGCGRRAAAVVTGVTRDQVSLSLGEPSVTRIAGPRITLVQAIPKGKNMDLIVQKAVELGIAGIQPLVTENTIVQPGEGKAAKWRRVALEACKQCGQDLLPSIGEPLAFTDWIRRQDSGKALRIIASLTPGSEIFKKILRENHTPEEIIYLVGPEGDFTAQETEIALDQGFIPVSLGQIVMRVETATLFGLAAIRYEYS